jgi:purine-binding chemotaxis protein CheW
MSTESTASQLRSAADLRHAFDAAFAAPLAPQTTPLETLLAIRVDGAPYAIRLAEIAGLFTAVRVEWVPTSMPALMGVTSVRGALVPVYDLRVLLGTGAAPMESPWMALVADRTIGLAFDETEGYTRVRQDEIVRRHDEAQHHVAEIAQPASAPRPIVSVASVLAEIRRRAQSIGTHRER